MKYKKAFRILSIAVILCLLIIAIPATPVLAQTIYCTPTSGTVGTVVTVTGYGFDPATHPTVHIFFDSTYVAVVSVLAGGSFTTSFSVSTYTTPGTHYVTARDGPTYATSTQLAMAYFTVTARQITLSPSSGYVGDTVTVSGTGFNASSTVTIYFDTTAVGTATTNTSGAFSGATFTVPDSYRGTHTVKGSDASGDSTGVNFTILQKITVTPASGAVGDTVTVSGTGFTASSSITFYFNTQSVSADTTTTNANGSFTNNTFTIPSSSRGSYTIEAEDASGYSATATFTIGQKIAITPATGIPGTLVTISGTGFRASQTITITYNAVAVTTNPAVITTGATGSFTATFNVPAGLAGTHPVEATDGTYSYSADFVATADATISQTTSTASPGYVGMELTITGTGFIPNATVTITYATEPVVLATATTDENGAFSAVITIPPSVGGSHTITVTDALTTKQFVFVMESEAPPAPTLLLPEADDKAKGEAYFDWEDVDDDSGVTYTLWIASDAGFSQVVLEKDGLTDSEYTLTEEEKLESVGKDEPYYWSVKAIDGASNEGPWANAWSFRVGFQWPKFVGWPLYTLLGFVGLLLFILGFWMGRRSVLA
jgi:hypothetical protein